MLLLQRVAKSPGHSEAHTELCITNEVFPWSSFYQCNVNKEDTILKQHLGVEMQNDFTCSFQ